ncbi:MAG: Fur family transcriptional regulator [Ilumatobacteraceae bacterium]
MNDHPDHSNHSDSSGDAERIDSILDQVRANGGRATSARRGILRALFDHHDVHPSVEHLTATVQATMPDVAESTVYRFLDELERLGVVQQVRLGTGPAVYHFAEDTDHHHLLCSDCGRVIEIPDRLFDSLRQRVRRDHAFEIDPQHLSIGGHCIECKPVEQHDREHSHPHPHG